jgi:hypothetical protein
MVVSLFENPAESTMLGVCCVQILLKNPLIWMDDFPYENQTTLIFAYE